ncbi:hypothetical protein [Pseudonocardia sp. 73-21]|uniref:hypothetical protein n=1 Tax=Pseudonocardia sp. 73-21 TaxID=1895809 RepID=UPI00263711A6|nr:hypothetical protein [Pseudonocardia sp. 73-21]
MLVEDVRFSATDPSAATSKVYELDQMRRSLPADSAGGHKRLLPSGAGGVIIGHTVDSSADPVQPETLSQVNATLVGAHYTPVRIVSINVHVLARSTPPTGTLFRSTSEGETPDPTMGFDLDSEDATPFVPLQDGPTPRIGKTRYFDVNQLTLTRNESVSLRLMLFARSGMYTFDFDVKTDDGRTATIDNNGQPWTVSSFARNYDRAYTVDFNAPTDRQIVSCNWPFSC